MYLKLTRVSGNENAEAIYINPSQIVSFSQSPGSEGSTLELVSEKRCRVRETPSEIQEMAAQLSGDSIAEELVNELMGGETSTSNSEDFDGDIFVLKFGSTVFSLEQIASNTMAAFVNEGESRDMISDVMEVTADNVVGTIETLVRQLTDSIEVEEQAASGKPHLKLVRRDEPELHT